MPIGLVVNPALPVRTPAELVPYGKANSKTLSFASGNTSSLIMGEMFSRGAGIEICSSFALRAILSRHRNWGASNALPSNPARGWSVVLGHTHCGAILGTLERLRRPAPPVSPHTRFIAECIKPALAGLLAPELGYDGTPRFAKAFERTCASPLGTCAKDRRSWNV